MPVDLLDDCECGRVEVPAGHEACGMCAAEAAEAELEAVRRALGLTGVTVTAKKVAALSGVERPLGALERLIRAGEAARVGHRYFPRSWAP